MSRAEERCAEIRSLLPELALGIADGEDRAAALEHLSACAECRSELAQLSTIADDLLALAPEAEPPVGFEGRTLDRLRGSVRIRTSRPWRRRLTLAAAVVATAVATAIVMVLAYRDDHQLATQYRAALQHANGQYFTSARMHTRDGRVGGLVFAYQGAPSWIFYTVEPRYRAGDYMEQIITRSGRSLSLPAFRMANASWGIVTPVPVREIAVVRLIHVDDATTLQANLPIVRR
jgi:hypothetical protein